MATKKRGKDLRHETAESTVTSSEPRIRLAQKAEPGQRDPMATLPEIDPLAAFEGDGCASDTIPAPPLLEEEDDEEPEP